MDIYFEVISSTAMSSNYINTLYIQATSSYITERKKNIYKNDDRVLLFELYEGCSKKYVILFLFIYSVEFHRHTLTISHALTIC